MQSYQDNNHTVLRDVFWQEFSRILALYSDQDKIYIGLSGGSSLDIFYKEIADSLSSIDPDICSRLRFCLLDERIVSEDHGDSNA
jgi:6-phosphogluconolactonase/glucosamine-6-phosphate isomerase/deaminase